MTVIVGSGSVGGAIVETVSLYGLHGYCNGYPLNKGTQLGMY